jgi:uncharacterized protein (DUF58 family)
MAGERDRRRASSSGAAEALAAALPPLTVRAEALASSISLGLHGRRKGGIGQSFWQFHRYRIEDSPSHIDWRQSARSQHLYVREREWEAAQSVYLWRAGGPSMRFASEPGRETKLDRATLLTLALSALLIRGGERVALCGEKDAPAASRAAYLRIAHALCERAPADDALPPDADLARNAQFVWFGDFLEPVNEIEAVLRRLIRFGVHGRLVHIVDPAEEDFPYIGRTRFEAPTGGETHLFGRAETVGGAYRRRFAARIETISQMARSLNWSYLRHRTDRPAKTALTALFADLSGAPAFPGEGGA